MAEDAEAWPENVTVSQVRLARMTHRFDAVIRFYTEGLGLALLGSFEAHAGYDGVSIGPHNPYWRAKAVIFHDPDGSSCFATRRASDLYHRSLRMTDGRSIGTQPHAA